MKARDVMVSPVITVSPHASGKQVAKTFLERRISAVPVVDEKGKLVGGGGVGLWGMNKGGRRRHDPRRRHGVAGDPAA